MSIDRFLISSDSTILQAMEKIDKNSRGIVFVCEGKKLVGTLTDGDVRRYVLKNGNLTHNVLTIVNSKAIYLRIDNEQRAIQMMDEKLIAAIPVLNSNNEIVKIYFAKGGVAEEEKRSCSDVPLVIMAGGKGTRLKPFTDILPKPLIPIGEKPITECIIDKFVQFGCNEIYMIVNYKKDFIKAYFQDGVYHDKVHFVDESVFMGTGGGLKLLEGKLDGPFFMSNCDILIEADYAAIYNYHKCKQNVLTMVCARKEFSIPYGTILVDEENVVTGLCEKPSHSYFANTGFYIINPEVLSMIPEDTFIHITDIVEMCLKEHKKIGAYIINDENWMDMGQFDEMDKMRQKLGFR